ncbi:unnamed protein product [Notodromas monacha]|uniref:Acetyl-CoA hydrolase n=1 Tax=Notodromas monacha TaxID=399045 RepID=A0A7R9BPR2_9CRUS|nr:unnamed protein product [Notodromas monacha]CAG0918541.1 unnamed protein product [Notodromas monacha]
MKMLQRGKLLCLAFRRSVNNFQTTKMCGVMMRDKHRTYYTQTMEPFHPLNREPVWMTAEDAVKPLKSGDLVFVQSAAMCPNVLVNAMCIHGKAAGLSNITVTHMHTEGPALYNNPEYEGIFRSNSLFVGSNSRKAVGEGRADYMPIFLSEIPLLFHTGRMKPSIALISITPPDAHGFCSLGASVDCTRAALQHSSFIIDDSLRVYSHSRIPISGQVNPRVPRTFGDGIIHKSHVDVMVEVDEPLPELVFKHTSKIETQIGEIIAQNLVEDGATLQMGIGNIPNAVLRSLKGHRNLGIHTEMFSDGIVPLVDCGAITNHEKKTQQGKIVSAFANGTQKLWDFMHDNPLIAMKDVAFTNNPWIICQNPKVTAINSCIEVDLTGQVVSDSIGPRIYSGVGGQVDFLRGAKLSSDGRGKPILAFPSTTKDGKSKVVPVLHEGAGIVTTRAHVQYVVTEYGIADLFGKNLRQRAYALINIAHPDHREALEQAAFERLKCLPSAD